MWHDTCFGQLKNKVLPTCAQLWICIYSTASCTVSNWGLPPPAGLITVLAYNLRDMSWGGLNPVLVLRLQNQRYAIPSWITIQIRCPTAMRLLIVGIARGIRYANVVPSLWGAFLKEAFMPTEEYKEIVTPRPVIRFWWWARKVPAFFFSLRPICRKTA